VLKEWLLIVWIGTSTNFTLLEYHYSFETCNEARERLKEDFVPPLILECRSDMREGRSKYSKRPGSHGLVK